MHPRRLSPRKIPALYYGVFLVIAVSAASGLVWYKDRHSSTIDIYNYFPVHQFFEFAIIVLCTLGIRRRWLHKEIVLTIALALLLIFSFAIFWIRNQSFLLFNDYLLIFKALIYLLLLSLCSTKLFKIWQIKNFFKFLTLAFFIKYAIAKIVFGIARPGLFTENNFELLLLNILYVLLVHQRTHIPTLYKWSFYATILLSGSFSGIASLLVLHVFFMPPRGGATSIIRYTGIIVLFGLGYFALSTRFESMEDVLAVDRLQFAKIFWNEVKGFSTFNWLFGAPIISPLSQPGCRSLIFYERLFSTGSANQCYSVVLHSFILRALYDHGIFGFFGIIYTTYHLIRRSFRERKIAIYIVAITVLNGLSVSSFNNTFFAFTMVLVVGVSNSAKKELADAPGLTTTA
jgi:hypothetical protein